MPRASYHQPAFTGGEISRSSQGRSDIPLYRQALRVSFNGIINENGSWTRRGGTLRAGPTYLRQVAKLLPFGSSVGCSFTMEFTAGTPALKFWSGNFPIFTNDALVITNSASTSSTINITFGSTPVWSNGDQLMLFFPGGYAASLEANTRGRVFTILSGAGTATLKLQDDISTNILPAAFVAGTSLVGATALRIKRFSTVYTAAQLPNLRVVQAQTQGLILCGGVPPYAIGVTEPTSGSTDPTFTFAAATFYDGPWNILQTDAPTGTVSGTSGSGVTFTPSGGSHTFPSTDVNRAIRLFWEPATWASGTTYNNGDLTTYPAGTNQYWQSMAGSNTGNTPGTTPLVAGVPTTYWVPAPFAARWAWGQITAASGGSTCTLTYGPDQSSLGGAAAALPGTAISAWQLGLFTAGSYPTVGTFAKGRLWLMGAVANQFDATMPIDASGTYLFAPTDQYGNVNDDNAISYQIQAKTNLQVCWMEPDVAGIVVGTIGGEGLIAASTLNDPLTPTTVDFNMVTFYGCAFIEPRRAGMAIIFAQRYQRTVEEYLADAFSQKYSAKPLNEFAKHMSLTGIQEIAYQEENIPVLWFRMGDGTLKSCTYRRVSRFVTEDPKIRAWSQQTLAWSVESMCVTPKETGLADALYVSVNQNGQRWVEIVQPVVEAEE